MNKHSQICYQALIFLLCVAIKTAHGAGFAFNKTYLGWTQQLNFTEDDIQFFDTANKLAIITSGYQNKAYAFNQSLMAVTAEVNNQSQSNMLYQFQDPNNQTLYMAQANAVNTVYLGPQNQLQTRSVKTWLGGSCAQTPVLVDQVNNQVQIRGPDNLLRRYNVSQSEHSLSNNHNQTRQQMIAQCTPVNQPLFIFDYINQTQIAQINLNYNTEQITGLQCTNNMFGIQNNSVFYIMCYIGMDQSFLIRVSSQSYSDQSQKIELYEAATQANDIYYDFKNNIMVFLTTNAKWSDITLQNIEFFVLYNNTSTALQEDHNVQEVIEEQSSLSTLDQTRLIIANVYSSTTLYNFFSFNATVSSQLYSPSTRLQQILLRNLNVFINDVGAFLESFTSPFNLILDASSYSFSSQATNYIKGFLDDSQCNIQAFLSNLGVVFQSKQNESITQKQLGPQILNRETRNFTTSNIIYDYKLINTQNSENYENNQVLLASSTDINLFNITNFKLTNIQHTDQETIAPQDIAQISSFNLLLLKTQKYIKLINFIDGSVNQDINISSFNISALSLPMFVNLPSVQVIGDDLSSSQMITVGQQGTSSPYSYFIQSQDLAGGHVQLNQGILGDCLPFDSSNNLIAENMTQTQNSNTTLFVLQYTEACTFALNGSISQANRNLNPNKTQVQVHVNRPSLTLEYEVIQLADLQVLAVGTNDILQTDPGACIMLINTIENKNSTFSFLSYQVGNIQLYRGQFSSTSDLTGQTIGISSDQLIYQSNSSNTQGAIFIGFQIGTRYNNSLSYQQLIFQEGVSNDVYINNIRNFSLTNSTFYGQSSYLVDHLNPQIQQIQEKNVTFILHQQVIYKIEQNNVSDLTVQFNRLPLPLQGQRSLEQKGSEPTQITIFGDPSYQSSNPAIIYINLYTLELMNLVQSDQMIVQSYSDILDDIATVTLFHKMDAAIQLQVDLTQKQDEQQFQVYYSQGESQTYEVQRLALQKSYFKNMSLTFVFNLSCQYNNFTDIQSQLQNMECPGCSFSFQGQGGCSGAQQQPLISADTIRAIPPATNITFLNLTVDSATFSSAWSLANQNYVNLTNILISECPNNQTLMGFQNIENLQIDEVEILGCNITNNIMNIRKINNLTICRLKINNNQIVFSSQFRDVINVQNSNMQIQNLSLVANTLKEDSSLISNAISNEVDIINIQSSSILSIVYSEIINNNQGGAVNQSLGGKMGVINSQIAPQTYVIQGVSIYNINQMNSFFNNNINVLLMQVNNTLLNDVGTSKYISIANSTFSNSTLLYPQFILYQGQNNNISSLQLLQANFISLVFNLSNESLIKSYQIGNILDTSNCQVNIQWTIFSEVSIQNASTTTLNNIKFDLGGYFYFDNSKILNTYCDNCTGTTQLQLASVSIVSSTFQGSRIAGAGGVIQLQKCPTTFISNSVFQGNHGTDGGVLQANLSTTINIVNSSFTQNSVTGSGGALYLSNSNVFINDSTIDSNSAGLGAGIQVDSGIVNIQGTSQLAQQINQKSQNLSGVKPSTSGGSFITQNRASSSGGGLYALASNVSVTCTVIAGNWAVGSQGGGLQIDQQSIQSPNLAFISLNLFFNNSADDGAAMYLESATTSIAASNFSQNAAQQLSGCIQNSFGKLTISNSSFDSNSASTGGVLQSEFGTILISQSNFTNNSAKSQFLGDLLSFQGGVIYLFYNDTLSMSSVYFGGNFAIQGGGVYSNQATVNIISSTFENHLGSQSGGVFYSTDGILSISNSAVMQNNVSGQGGVIYGDSNTIQLEGSAFDNNLANEAGVAQTTSAKLLSIITSSFNYNAANGQGGVISGIQSAVDISASNFGSNSASCGGSIQSKGGVVSISGSNFTNNSVNQNRQAALAQEGQPQFNISGGGAIAIQQGGLIINASQFVNNGAIYQLGGAVQGYINATSFNISVNNSQFERNEAVSGGAIWAQSNSLTLQSNIFNLNSAQKQGGAVVSQQIGVQLQQNIFYSNSAKEGGGIKFLQPTSRLNLPSSTKLMAYVTDNQGTYNNSFNNTFRFNSASQYGNDSATIPTNLTMTTFSVLNDTRLLEEENLSDNNTIIINEPQSFLSLTEFYNSKNLYSYSSSHSHTYPHTPPLRRLAAPAQITESLRSGATVQVALQALDEENNIIQGSVDTIQAKISTDNKTQLSVSAQNNSVVASQNESQQIILSDLNMLSQPKAASNVFFYGPQIVSDQQTTDTSMPNIINMNINILYTGCAKGYVFGQESGGLLCTVCANNSQSFVDNPDSNTQCVKCANIEGIDNCSASQIQLLPGQWREYPNGTQVIDCSNQESNCVGGVGPGFCAEGHVGPLCEACDTNNVQGNGTQGRTGSQSCYPCSSVNVVNTLMVVASLILVFGLLLQNLTANYNSTTKKIYVEQLRRMSIMPIITSGINISSSILKIMLNYISIAFTVTQFDLDVSSSFSFLPQVVGSPLEATQLSIDCLFTGAMNNTPIIQVKVLISILLPFAILIISILLLLIGLRVFKINKKRINSFITTNILFLCFLLQPSVCKLLIQTLSCRTIGNRQQMVADVSQECQTDQHVRWILFCILPSTIFQQILIPLGILVKLYQIKDNLQRIDTMYSYGFLQVEYNPRCQMWEVLKTIQKNLVVLVLTQFQSDFVSKAGYLLAILNIYLFLLSKYKPQFQKNLLVLESLSTIISQANIVLVILTQNKSPDNPQRIIMIVLIIIINITLTMFLSANLMSSYLSLVKEILIKINNLLNIQLPNIFKKYIEVADRNKMRVFLNLRRLAQKTRKFIKEKKKLDIIQSMNEDQNLLGDSIHSSRDQYLSLHSEQTSLPVNIESEGEVKSSKIQELEMPELSMTKHNILFEFDR